MNDVCNHCGVKIGGPVRAYPQESCLECEAWFKVHPTQTQGEKILQHQINKLNGVLSSRIDDLRRQLSHIANRDYRGNQPQSGYGSSGGGGHD